MQSKMDSRFNNSKHINMQKVLLSFAALLCIIGSTISQPRGHENRYKQVSPIETPEYSLEISDAHSQTNFTLFRAILTNKTSDYLVYRQADVVFNYDHGKFTQVERLYLIKPKAKLVRVMKVAGGDKFHVDKLTVDFNCYSRLALTGAHENVPNYVISTTGEKDYKAGNFRYKVLIVTKETRETYALFEVEYTGTDFGIVDPRKLKVTLDDGQEFENYKHLRLRILKPGQKMKIGTVFRIPVKTANMHKVNLEIIWNETFVESKPVKLASQTMVLEMDPNKIVAKAEPRAPRTPPAKTTASRDTEAAKREAELAKLEAETAHREVAAAHRETEKAQSDAQKAIAEAELAKAEAILMQAQAAKAKAEAEKAIAEAELARANIEKEQAQNQTQSSTDVKYRGSGDPLKGLNVSTAATTMEVGNYYALLIGIDEYRGKWPSLDNAVNDVEEIEKLLKSKYKFDHFITLYDFHATRTAIIKQMEWLIDNVKPEDNVFIYYSGHGEFKQNLNKGYWVPHDALTKSTSEYISNNDIQTYLGGIRSKHTLLVSDACFSGDIFRGTTISVPFEDSEKYYKKIHKMPSRKAMTSGGIEPVMDGGRDGHSVFAYYFLKSLRNNEAKYFDATQLYSDLKIPVINNSEQSPRFSPVKNTGDEGGQFVFIRK
ncbi:MAG: hypothetical protein COB85_05420 [Bacteroidetes bacterium]|nr:MAG: hypothetical protein COB85_05420 [Bacteroidota bacterium]